MDSIIKFVHNSEIDLIKWDRVIDDSPNSRVYANSWYLDILNPDWHGLIYGDYNYVMPIVFSEKMLVKYIYQPIFSQQHGIFPPSTPEITAQFLNFLLQRFRFIDISLNSMNIVNGADFEITKRKNFLLSLRESYSTLHGNYANVCKKNLKNASRRNTISKGIALDEFMDFYAQNIKVKLSSSVLKSLNLIISKAMSMNAGEIYGAYSGHNELCGVAFFLKGKNRYIYLASVSSELGRKNSSMYSIVDTFIQNHSEQPFYFDFEGSNIDSIAFFFSGFGAQPEIYQHLKYNNLPWAIKLFKK